MSEALHTQCRELTTGDVELAVHTGFAFTIGKMNSGCLVKTFFYCVEYLNLPKAKALINILFASSFNLFRGQKKFEMYHSALF